jgi:5-methylcytosine-specific restriction protein B
MEVDVTQSDQVIQYVLRSYIEPARKRGDAEVSIKAGDVHKALRWSNRVPSVCQALASKRFLEQNQLTLTEKQGPPSGLSTTTVFTYRLEAESNTSSTPSRKASLLLSLRGSGKELFRKLGGGEAFLRAERRSWSAQETPRSRGTA